jgi:NifU-like protein involved in Fe-S cluster formation
MANYKAVFFTNDLLRQYMNEQKLAIENALPDVTTELAEDDDSRLALYSKTPKRMPCIMLFKDDARMLLKHAKREHSEIVDWIKAAIGS